MPWFCRHIIDFDSHETNERHSFNFSSILLQCYCYGKEPEKTRDCQIRGQATVARIESWSPWFKVCKNERLTKPDRSSRFIALRSATTKLFSQSANLSITFVLEMTKTLSRGEIVYMQWCVSVVHNFLKQNTQYGSMASGVHGDILNLLGRVRRTGVSRPQQRWPYHLRSTRLCGIIGQKIKINWQQNTLLLHFLGANQKWFST